MILNPDLEATLHAVANRIIPADDYPNASDADVSVYLQRQLGTDLRDAVASYEAGLAAINDEAQARFNTNFVALDERQQDELLHALEHGKVMTSWRIAPRRFFEMLVQHVAEGYYSNPQNGGNKDSVAWEMVGFPARCE
jgi:gluconate 2-dehydrogenase gamma chain